MTSARRPPPEGRVSGALLLALFTLAGFALRLPLLGRFPFREDEAIYGYWALHGWYNDPFFLQVWPDKPPILLWLLGLAFQLWGHTPATAEPAARWLSIVASTLTIPVLAAIARRWWGWTAALAAGALAAFNPFAVSFAPTAYTDPVLVLAGSLALAFAVRGRPFWSGLWLGVAVMTKQQGLLFAPLVVGALAPATLTLDKMGGLRSPPNESPPNEFGGYSMQNRLKPVGVYVSSFLLGLGLIVVPIFYWDSLRWAVAPSPWDLGAANVGGVALLPPDEWPARAAAWGELAWYLLASPWVWAIYAFVLAAAILQAARRRAPARAWLPALLLAAWAGGCLFLHIATNVQVWDRYLLPLTVPLALLGGWVGWTATSRRWHFLEVALPGGGTSWRWPLVILVALTLPPAWQAAQGQLPIGGDHGDYAGLNEALAAVNAPGALLFHRELGWHARFALFDAVRSGDVQLRYYPSSIYLADSAAKFPHKQRFVIAPDWSPLPDLPMQLAMRGLQAEAALRAGHFTVYRIDERATGDASWRVCAPPVVYDTELWERRDERTQ
jgi:hypothetical protein